MSETLSLPISREQARPGTPLALLGGLPMTVAELQASFAPKPVIISPRVELVAEPPPSVAKANNDYLNQVGNISPALGAILRPQAAYRWLLPYLAAITPQYVETILRGALAGNHVQAWELFDLMVDSNPEIAACIGEYIDGISEKKLIIEPYHEEDEQPTATAIRNQKMVSAALRNMRPEPANDENALRATVRDILFSRFHGQSILEEDWYDTYGTGQLNRLAVAGVGPIVAPRCTYWVHPVCYAWDMDGRLGLRIALANQIQQFSQKAKSSKPGSRPDPVYNTSDFNFTEPPIWNFISSQPMPGNVMNFPKNKFLISIFKAKTGTALSASCLRSLAAWWTFENFAADYAMDLAQIFGIPFRTATFSANTSEPDKAFVREMLQNMGSRGWAMLPEGVTLTFEKAMATGAESPQGFLIKLCHEQYRKVILRQTMTGSGHGGASSGSKAGMGVETDVKAQCLNAGAQFACEILRDQAARHILQVNLGSDDELPFISMLDDDEGGLEEAQTLQALSTAGAGKCIGLKWVNKKFNIPIPLDGEETLADAAPTVPPISSRANEPQKDQAELNAELADSKVQIQKSKIVDAYAASLAATISPLVKYLKAGLELPADAQRHYFERAIEQWPKLTKPLQADASSADQLTPELVKSFVEGLTTKVAAPRANTKSTLQAGDVPGHEFHGNQYVELADEKWTGTPKEMHKRADGIMRGFKSATNPELGEVQFSKEGRDKTLFDKRTPHEFQSVQALPKIIEQGKVVSSEPDRKGRAEIQAVHKIEHGLKIGDSKYRAEVTVRQVKQGPAVAQKFYLHRLKP